MRGDEKRAFIASVATQVDDGRCVDWPWSVDGRGYAQMWDEGTVKKVSHFVLLATGHLRPEPPNHQALHACDRPRCVAPWHLRWGNQSDNLLEMFERQRRVIDQPRDSEGNYVLAHH